MMQCVRNLSQLDYFDFFNVKLEMDDIPLDRRTALFKSFEKRLKYFTVEYLPTLKELA